jgi:hypothetical protein
VTIAVTIAAGARLNFRHLATQQRGRGRVCVPSHCPLLSINIKWAVDPRGRTQMLRLTPSTQHSRKWADALRREMQMAIGQQLRDKYEVPQELTPQASTPPIRKDKENDPYADIVGTC